MTSSPPCAGGTTEAAGTGRVVLRIFVERRGPKDLQAMSLGTTRSALWEAMKDTTMIAAGLLPEDHGSLEHITLHAQLGDLFLQVAQAFGVDLFWSSFASLVARSWPTQLTSPPLGYAQVLGYLGGRLAPIPELRIALSRKSGRGTLVSLVSCVIGVSGIASP
jgi:hypothetical protein